MVSYLEFQFKIVWTAIARTYRFRKNTTVSEFIDEIKKVCISISYSRKPTCQVFFFISKF